MKADHVNQCDPHRRAECDRAANLQIKLERQRKANAREWLKRAKRSIDQGKLDTAINQIRQAQSCEAAVRLTAEYPGPGMYDYPEH
jgi:hypothetical protein